VQGVPHRADCRSAPRSSWRRSGGRSPSRRRAPPVPSRMCVKPGLLAKRVGNDISSRPQRRRTVRPVGQRRLISTASTSSRHARRREGPPPGRTGQCAFHRQRRRERPTYQPAMSTLGYHHGEGGSRMLLLRHLVVDGPPDSERSHPPRGTRSRSRSPDPWPCVDVSGHLPDRAVRDAPAGLAQRVALSLAPTAFAASVKVEAPAVRRRATLLLGLPARPGHNDERAARDRVAHCPAIPLTERVG
jgi:hypothetical protein